MSGAAGPPTAIVHPQRGNRTGQCFKRRTIELNLCVKIYASKFMRQFMRQTRLVLSELFLESANPGSR
jgi:hypothetical protein